ncbi:MAG TPA: hypothetical protein VHB73_05975 [Alphaproteobacteria bacterium]|nr:hypothetical protein [Alphaproteobacteria bacterium]
MFMFVFAVILISIVGLFFQVINALTLYLASHQMGVGQQMFAWQNLAMDYACATAIPPGTAPSFGTVYADTETDATIKTGINDIRPEYTGVKWNTVIFDGKYGTSDSHLVLSYISPSGTMAGYSVGEIKRQFLLAFKNNDYTFSEVMGGSMSVNVYAAGGAPASVQITGIPSTVADHVNGMVTSVECP